MNANAPKETYLGDGLYVSFLHGFQIKLRAPRENGDHVIYMEAGELNAFINFLKVHVAGVKL